MLARLRLEIMFICFAGLMFQNANYILFIIIFLFFILNIITNIFVIKELRNNEKREEAIKDFAKGIEKIDYKNWISKIIYVISLIGILIISIYLKSSFLITIAIITILFEVYKIKLIREKIKAS